MTQSLRDEIEVRVITFGYHADEVGAYKICTNEIMKVIEKRIDELKTKYPKDLYRAYNAGLEDIQEMLK